VRSKTVLYLSLKILFVRICRSVLADGLPIVRHVPCHDSTGTEKLGHACVSQTHDYSVRAVEERIIMIGRKLLLISGSVCNEVV
jgi:hypothetical protein